MTFSYSVLGQPRESGKKKSSVMFVDWVRRNIKERRTPEDNCGDAPVKKKRATSAPSAKDIARKLQDGNVAGCVRILAEEDSVCAIIEEVIVTMEEKHPASSPIVAETPSRTDVRFPPITTEEVKKLIYSFPEGTSGGSAGLSPGISRNCCPCANRLTKG